MSQNTGTTIVHGAAPRAMPFILAGFVAILAVVGMIAAVAIGQEAFESSADAGGTTIALGRADDYALRQAGPPATLGRADDWATRQAPAAPTLDRDDDYALRHAVVLPTLGRADDWATRQAPAAPTLDRDDDYALRQR